MNQELLDRLEIRQLVENWAIWRDAGYWDRFRTCWHDDGWMMATWIRGSYETFIEANIAGWDKPGSILHFLGGSTVYLKGDYAICETKMTISQRGMVGTIACDVVCTGRFYDFIERRNGRWGIVLRQPIYEKDRIDPVDPTAQLELDPAILNLYPEGCRHLCTIQHMAGFKVKNDMPGLKGPLVEQLYELGEKWLTGNAYDDVIAWRTYGHQGER